MSAYGSQTLIMCCLDVFHEEDQIDEFQRKYEQKNSGIVLCTVIDNSTSDWKLFDFCCFTSTTTTKMIITTTTTTATKKINTTTTATKKINTTTTTTKKINTTTTTTRFDHNEVIAILIFLCLISLRLRSDLSTILLLSRDITSTNYSTLRVLLACCKGQTNT